MTQYRKVVLLLSTYDLGRQPFGLASASAALLAAGVEVACTDLTREKLDLETVRRARAVAFFVPMHTATRLALPVIDQVRTANAGARMIAYGLYAPLNADLLRERGVTTIIGGEFEDALVEAVRGAVVPPPVSGSVPRVTFRVPERSGLLPLARYATLQTAGGPQLAGYTEASRGCKHRCRHCPIVPVYDGRFRVVPVDVVLADVAAQVASGARHITFGDPDFFNGIGHATAILERFAAGFPGITCDVTIKIEHLVRHGDLLPLLRSSGCAFVTSAVESVEDDVLRALEKGHTRADFEQVADRFRDLGMVLVPTFVAFTPWTTLDGYCDLLQTLDRLDLVDHVAPIQLAIRLLVTHSSRLLDLAAVRAVCQPFNARSLTYPWVHPDPRVDALHQRVDADVGTQLSVPRRELFARIWTIAHEMAGVGGVQPIDRPEAGGMPVPYLNEPWYCCAEPTADQVRLL